MAKNSYVKIIFAGLIISIFSLSFLVYSNKSIEKIIKKYDVSGLSIATIRKINYSQVKNYTKDDKVMKKLPLGIQTFSKIINDNYVYVDKTEHIYELIQEHAVFLTRPRRFGRSLLCSTLKELFSGNRELFKGLWIDKNTDYKWPVHPVIHLDLSKVDKTSPGALTASLMRHLDEIAELYELEKLEHTYPGEMLADLTRSLYKKFGSKNGVVIIVDEYEKPILDNIDKIEVAKDMHKILMNFYKFVKGLDRYLKFVFISGVTHISMASMFSGMNHLNNISMHTKYAHLLGFTQDEISFYFKEHLEKIAHLKKISLDELMGSLNDWYGGYSFCSEHRLFAREETETEKQESVRLSVPFSIFNFLDTAEFKNYWFESGTPSCLIKVLKQKKDSIESLESFENLKVCDSTLMTLDVESISLVTLLYQTGYATIKDYNDLYQCYSLKVPNREVKESLEILKQIK